eukprot:TRINITY_DN1983_c0_g1_i6.p1 TRINITY_DN1983_c0_g1~~TRINITY_DN1983_c0_g1_i6.p1  ORF type:complete len:512 (-),score=68.14 TRINITY_DN1983_c0_g1_i6:155-1690(-)
MAMLRGLGRGLLCNGVCLMLLTGTLDASEVNDARPNVIVTDLWWRSDCETQEYAGLVLYFHGFSANPSQISRVAPQLASKCYDVFAPVLPGHDAQILDCSQQKCSVDYDGVHGWDLTKLPTKPSQWDAFVTSSVQVAHKDLNDRTLEAGLVPGQPNFVAFGLSHGAAMAFQAVTKYPDYFTSQLLLNPFFGAGDEESDLVARECLEQVMKKKETPQVCAEKMRTQLASLVGIKPHTWKWLPSRLLLWGSTAGYVRRSMLKMLTLYKWMPHFLFSRFFDSKMVWGENCAGIVTQQKGGFCAFQRKHVLALHAYSMDVASVNILPGFLSSGIEMPTTAVMMTERDGISRNGLSYSLVNRIKSAQSSVADVSMCMYPFREGTDIYSRSEYWNNENVLDHAAIGKEQLPGQPHWFEPKLSTTIVNFLAGITTHVGEKPWERKRNGCMALPFGTQSEAVSQLPELPILVLPEADPLWRDSKRSWPWGTLEASGFGASTATETTSVQQIASLEFRVI